MSDTPVNEIAKASPNMRTERIEQLKTLFPDLFDGEGQLDEKSLRALISDETGVAAERFSFEWAGKQKSKRLAFTPSRATLTYDPSRSLNSDGAENKAEETPQQNTSENLIIEGDNLEVLKLLQATYFEQVKCIYIDPPYNTGKNYIYPNDYSQTKKEYWEESGGTQYGVKLVANTEHSGKFHSNWLSMMYSRILIARKLLREDGVLICAIDENELATLSQLLKGVFGEGVYDYFYVSVIHNPRGQQGKNFSYINDYLIFVYPTGKKVIADKKIPEEKIKWSQFRNWGGKSLRSDAKNCFYPVIVQNEKIVGFGDICEDNSHPKQTEWHHDCAYVYPIDNEGNERKWRYALQSVNEIKDLLRTKKTENGYQIEIGKDFETYKSIWNDNRHDANEYGTKIINELIPGSGFTFPKSLWAVYDAISAVVENDKEAIVLDFFAGSGTTAHAVMQKNIEDNGNRKHIMVQIPDFTDEKSESYKAGYKKISDITIERVKRAGAKIREKNPDTTIDTGFRVFKLTHSNFSENLFTPDEDKSNAENIKALEAHLAAAAQMRLFDTDEFSNLVTEISLKNGFGLFYQLEAMTDFEHNKIYRLHGNGKTAILCLDNSLHDASVENLKPFNEEQLIVSKSALDTSKKFSLQTEFKDNLWVV